MGQLFEDVYGLVRRAAAEQVLIYAAFILRNSITVSG